MRTAGLAAALALVATSAGATEALLQKAPAQNVIIERLLPSPTPGVPWLELDTRTKMPKGDFPLGRHADAVPDLTLAPASPSWRTAVHDTGGSS
jgi:hypothetical protein